MSVLRLILAAVLLPAVAPPALAQQNAYGGHDIVAYPAAETAYGEARGWRVGAARSGAGFAYCFAEAPRRGGPAVRLGWDGMQWQLAAQVPAPADWQGSLQVDGAGAGRGYRSGGDLVSGTAAGGWTIAWIGLPELDALRQGSQAVLGVGRGDVDFALSGSAAAILKVEECVQRGGQAPQAAARPAPATGASGASRCPDPRSMVSRDSGGQASAYFVNATDRALMIYWVDRSGNLVEMGPLPVNDGTTLTTTIGHTFQVQDFQGLCYGGGIRVDGPAIRIDLR